MKTLVGDCSCGAKSCTTTYKISPDSENEHNILFSIVDDRHDLETWVSLNKEDYQTIVKFLRQKFGRVE